MSDYWWVPLTTNVVSGLYEVVKKSRKDIIKYKTLEDKFDSE